jgi:small subunit ribosomal protein S20
LPKLDKTERRRLRNKSVRTYVKTCSTRAQDLIAQKETDTAREAVAAATSALDVAAKKGVIHPNKAARRKSRLVKKLNQATRSQA